MEHSKQQGALNFNDLIGPTRIESPNMEMPFFYIVVKEFQKLASTLLGDYSLIVDGNIQNLGHEYDSLFSGNGNITKDSPTSFLDVRHFDDYQFVLREQYGIKYLAVNHYNEMVSGAYFRMIAAPKGQLSRLLLKHKRQNKTILTEPILHKEDRDNTIGAVKRFLSNRKRLASMGVTANKGILMYGEPGNGKTLISNYIKRYCESKRLAVAVVNQGNLHKQDFYGDVLIFDDFSIDNLVNRSDTTDLLLTEMDGPNKESGRIFIFTTNELKEEGQLYEALVRPGRIDTVVKLSKPTKDLISKYVDSWKVPLSDDQKYEIVRNSVGCSFAQLNYVQTEIAMRQIERKPIVIKDVFKVCNIKMKDFRKAQSRIGFGGLTEDSSLTEFEDIS